MSINCRSLLLGVCLFVSSLLPLRADSFTDAAAAPVPPQDRTVILFSLDGFRWDYLQKYHPTNLNRLAAEGVHMTRMISSFPSLTFPNHQAMATGLYPAHHGVVNNTFYDPVLKTNFNYASTNALESRWWSGEPIWVTAVKQGRIADCMFWPGTGAAIGGVRPTEYLPYDGKASPKVTPNEVVDTGLKWLDQPADKRPSLIVLYCHHTDTVGHHQGPDTPQMAETVQLVDTAIGRLVEGIHRLNLDRAVDLVIVSDHGMTELSTNRLIVLSDFVDTDKVQVDATGAVGFLRPLDGNVDALYKAFKSREDHFHVYLRDKTPRRYHFRTSDNPGDRIPPIIIVADEGWYITKKPKIGKAAEDMNKATHGYDPQVKSMGATFIAYGPAFKHGVTIGPEENIHIYNLLCATLGLQPAPNDGDNRLVKKVLIQ